MYVSPPAVLAEVLFLSHTPLSSFPLSSSRRMVTALRPDLHQRPRLSFARRVLRVLRRGRPPHTHVRLWVCSPLPLPFFISPCCTQTNLLLIPSLRFHLYLVYSYHLLHTHNLSSHAPYIMPPPVRVRAAGEGDPVSRPILRKEEVLGVPSPGLEGECPFAEGERKCVLGGWVSPLFSFSSLALI